MCRVSVRLLSTLEFMWVIGMNLTSLVNQEIVTSFRGLYHAIFPHYGCVPRKSEMNK